MKGFCETKLYLFLIWFIHISFVEYVELMNLVYLEI
jgi:hypothetical protein